MMIGKKLAETVEVIEATIHVLSTMALDVCESLELNLQRSSVSEMASKLTAIINRLPEPIQNEIYRILGS